MPLNHIHSHSLDPYCLLCLPSTPHLFQIRIENFNSELKARAAPLLLPSPLRLGTVLCVCVCVCVCACVCVCVCLSLCVCVCVCSINAHSALLSICHEAIKTDPWGG